MQCQLAEVHRPGDRPGATERTTDKAEWAIKMNEKNDLMKALQTLLSPIIKEVVLATIDEQREKQPSVKDDVRLTAAAAAEQLNTTKITLWRWAKQGYLSPIKIGRKVYYLQSEINKLTQRGEREP